MECDMEYYALMIMIGGGILYSMLNLYPIILYTIKTIKSHNWEDWVNMPFMILMLLIPFMGSLIGATMIEDNKFFKIIFYISVYLIIIGFVILVINNT